MGLEGHRIRLPRVWTYFLKKSGLHPGDNEEPSRVLSGMRSFYVLEKPKFSKTYVLEKPLGCPFREKGQW